MNKSQIFNLGNQKSTARRLRSAVLVFMAGVFALGQVSTAFADITNDAKAVGEYNNSPVESTISSQSVPVVTSAPNMTLAYSGVLNDDDGTSGLSAGDTISYTLVVTNPGNTSLTSLDVDDLLATLTLQAGSDVNDNGRLEPNETWTYKGDYTLTALDLATNGLQTGEAEADGEIDDTVTVNSDQLPAKTASSAIEIDPSVEMSIANVGTYKDDDGIAGLSAGDHIDYVITVTNDGQRNLSNILVSDAHVQGSSSTNLTAIFDETTDTNSDDLINPSEVFKYTISYEITQANIDNGDDLVNTASVTSDEIGPREDADTYAFDSNDFINSYTMEKLVAIDDTNSNSLGDLGETINYTFRFKNTGNATLTNLKAIDALPNLSAITCSSDGDSDGDIDTLAPSAQADCSASIVISSTHVAEGKVDNVATSTAMKADGVTAVIEDDTADDNKTSTPTHTVYQLAVNSEGALNDNDGIAGPSAGDAILYTVTVSNPSTGNLTDITVNDPLVTLALQAGGDVNDNGIMEPGESWVYTGVYILLASDFANNGDGDGDIDTTVTVDSAQSDAQTDSAEVSIESDAAFTIATSGTLNDDDGVTGVSAGDTIDYVISVENIATSDLTNVAITENLAQGTNSQSLSPVLVASSDANGDNRINAGETWVYEVSYTLTNDNINDGTQITYNASAATLEVALKSDDDVQPLTGIIDSYNLEVASALVDGDGDGKGDVGESVDFTFTFTNSGSRDLLDLTAISSLAGMSNLVCTNDANGDGKIDALAVGQTISCTATHVLTQADLDAGELVNTVTASAETAAGTSVTPETVGGSGSGSVALTLDALSGLELTKTLTKMKTPFPSIYELEYTLKLENTGSVTLTNLDLIDNIEDAIDAPAFIDGTVEIVDVTGAISQTDINSAFDGKTQIQVLASGFNLGAGEEGSVTLNVRVNRLADDLMISNQAVANANQLDDAVYSDDYTVTPNNSSDVNPTVLAMLDSDHDGVTDDMESGDSDGDGVPNKQDYDPTGYLYCQEDGQILKLGDKEIRIENVTHGGSQSGIGNSNSISILQDGSTGYFQFLVSRAGRYRMVIPTPDGVSPSSDRPSQGVMDVNSFLPTNPVVLGSGVDGTGEKLQDFTAANNPYYLEFDIAENAPNVFENNIPFENCSTSSFQPNLSLVGTPELQEDGSSVVTYALEVTNSGSVPIDDVSFEDNLASVFGTDYSVNNISIDSAPSGFGATVEPSFDGDFNTSLLTSGGTLDIDESVKVLLEVTITAPPGDYINVVQVNAMSSVSNALIGEQTAQVALSRTITGEQEGVVALKTTPVVAAPLGSIVPYTITINNNAEFDITDAEVVDFVPQGFSYVKGTARINGSAAEPVISNARELYWPGQTLATGNSITVTLSLAMGANASGTTFINSAFLRNSITGETITNVAKVSIELEVESLFQCSQIIGRVFDDLDKDGYYDKGEPGIAGARVVTVNGLLITTDEFGRYHVACDQIPADRIGSNYILKLDERTLPTGYKVTSENPRVVRATRGKLVKLNFAAANLRIVSVELKDSSFKQGSTSLNRAAIRDIARILPILEEETSVLKINYVTEENVSRVHKKKLKAVKNLVLKAWRARKRDYRLKVDTKVREY